MIVGHGIDIQLISAIAKAFDKSPRFAQKVLTPLELERFDQLKGSRQMAYLAGRWAAKEAFAKAWGTGIGIGSLGFQDLEFATGDKGAPVCTKSPFEGSCHVSISHSGDTVIASVILEEGS